MASITLRDTKGAPLTNAEVDGNFSNLNSGKMEKSSNLSDVTDAAAARTNLDVYSKAESDASGGSYIHEWTVDVGGVLNSYYPVVLDLLPDRFTYMDISRGFSDTPRSSVMGLFSRWAFVGGTSGNGLRVAPLLYHYSYRTPVARAGRIAYTNRAVIWLHGGMRYNISSNCDYVNPTAYTERTLVYDSPHDFLRQYVDVLTSVDSTMVSNGWGLNGSFVSFVPSM